MNREYNISLINNIFSYITFKLFKPAITQMVLQEIFLARSTQRKAF